MHKNIVPTLLLSLGVLITAKTYVPILAANFAGVIPTSHQTALFVNF